MARLVLKPRRSLSPGQCPNQNPFSSYLAGRSLSRLSTVPDSPHRPARTRLSGQHGLGQSDVDGADTPDLGARRPLLVVGHQVVHHPLRGRVGRLRQRVLVVDVQLKGQVDGAGARRAKTVDEDLVVAFFEQLFTAHKLSLKD